MSDDCDDEIRAVIKTYHEHTSRLLALALARFDRFPRGVLNELRSAMTHMARAAHASSLPIEARKEECKKAATHVERATIDCLKVLVIVGAREVREEIRTRRRHFPLSDEVIQAWRDIRELRDRIQVREAQEGDAAQIRLEYMQLFLKIQALQKTLDEGDGRHPLAGFSRFLRGLARSNVLWGLLFTVIGLVGGYVLAQWGPPIPKPSWLSAIARPSAPAEPKPSTQEPLAPPPVTP